MTKEKEKKLYTVLIALFAVGTVLVILLTAGARRTRAENAAQEASSDAQEEVTVVRKFIEVEKEITAETLQSGLRDMGTLITEEYYFTEVAEFSSIKKLFQTIDLKFTESSFLISYDGTVSAGIDFSAITVDKKDDRITVHIPKADIQSIAIDPGSFTLYSEKSGVGNPLSVEDYNNSLLELEKTAQEKAVEKGLLTRADENAREIIRRFVEGLTEPAVYPLSFVTQE